LDVPLRVAAVQLLSGLGQEHALAADRSPGGLNTAAQAALTHRASPATP